MKFVIADVLDPCPLCNLYSIKILNGSASLKRDPGNLEYKLRFCPICGKELLTKEEWLENNMKQYLEDKEQGRNVELYSEYIKYMEENVEWSLLLCLKDLVNLF